MPDYYHALALTLTALLLPAFGYLYLRFRDTRTLLWFLGFCFVLFAMAMLYGPGGSVGFSGQSDPWLAAGGQTCIEISSALFLASLSPLRFHVGQLQVLYVIPYTLPLVAASVLLYGVFHGATPPGVEFLVFPVLGAVCLLAALFWGGAKGIMPAWIGIPVCAVLGGITLWVCFRDGAALALTAVECANLQMTALLLVFYFRRFSPGVFLSVLGFLAWSLSALQVFPGFTHGQGLGITLIRIIVMGKVVAAIGMILLALEDELNLNRAAREREYRTRKELEAYAKLILARRRVEDFDRQGSGICEIVVNHSRFAQAALLLESQGRYRLVGSAGLDSATTAALDSLAPRIPVEGFLAPGSAPAVVEQSQVLKLDLTPWLAPGDDLKGLRFTEALAVPMIGRSATEGVLLLAGMRLSEDRLPTRAPGAPGTDVLRADDLLPIELLAARLQATRSQTLMFEKLIDSEKFAGLGQLAGNVTQQLNNPLTVILGYASLLEETAPMEPPERKGIEAILTEARRMRSTLESLLRISRPHGDQMAAVSVVELLNDMEQLYRPEFLQRSIEFRISAAPDLPRVYSSSQQLRQAVLHCLQFAMAAVERPSPDGEQESKLIRLEAACENNLVKILVVHSGPGFLQPDRAFDPFVPVQHGGEMTGPGLSLCSTILRDNNGRAFAMNLEPHGAAIVLELPAA